MPQCDCFSLPAALSAEAQDHRHAFARAVEACAGEVPDDESFAAELGYVFTCSRFVTRLCLRNAPLLLDLHASGDLQRRYGPEDGRRRLQAALDAAREAGTLPAAPEAQGLRPALSVLQKLLRRHRQREMLRIAWRDLSRRADLAETLDDLSALADACVDEILGVLHAWHCAAYGTPRPADGRPQRLVVVAMGKLGGRELNFSSDIDLIFAFPQAGLTDRPGNGMPHDEFFVRLARNLIQALGAVTPDGIVFRVDMRLRPDGESGPLALSFEATESYYQSQGREWERYAWIKARVISGDPAHGRQLLQALKPFVFRRYLDYGVFDALRDMKQKIALEIQRRGLEHNIKLGPGGIREIEFFGQIFQLLRGGVVPELQERRILTVLATLARQAHIPPETAADLEAAYLFLRQIENRLQIYDDQQTHDLPGERLECERLAAAMGFCDWSTCDRQLKGHRERVQRHFNSLLELKDAPLADGPHDVTALAAAWHKPADTEAMRTALAAAGFEDPSEALRLLRHLQNLPETRQLSPVGRQRLDRLLPLVLREAAGTENATAVLKRMVDLLGSIERRTTYIALLLEHPATVRHLTRLVGASPWIASFLARHPVVLDELLDPRTLYAPPRRAQMQASLSERIAAIDPENLEHQIEALCIFQQTNTLRVAAADIAGTLPLMKVSDYLSDIAEIIIESVVELAWRHLVGKHGAPTFALDGEPLDKGFAVIAYGKLGGLELGYGSDLDLVFIHAGTPGVTDGARPIDNSQFFGRLGQRVVHILTTHTVAGRIYEIDMRLRPSGSSGLLVSHFKAFGEYQARDAWTWEHQALLRTRAVSGDPGLIRWFERMRRDILTRPREPQKLRAEIVAMRDRMRSELLKPQAGRFDLKQGSGGIVDIEFLVQYLVLLEAHRHPELTAWSDNVRQLQTLARSGILDDRTAHFLRQAYLVYRASTHRLSLQEKPARTDDRRFQTLRRNVRAIWRRYLETAPAAP